MSTEDLRAAIGLHARGRGLPTKVPRQFLVREDSGVQAAEATYRPVLCFVAAGTKTVVAGVHEVTVGEGEMFIGLLRLPALVSFSSPYLSTMLDIDPGTLARVLATLPASAAQLPPSTAFFTAAMTDKLSAAVARWVDLLDEPEHISALAPHLEEEIIYRVVQSELGPALRATVGGGILAAVRSAAESIMEHPAEPTRVDDLARTAGVSPATFYRRFRELTGYSPVRFQKLARLQSARRSLLAGGHTASAAALAVGYLSPQQFSRDYSRQYGVSPARDANAMRAPRSQA